MSDALGGNVEHGLATFFREDDWLYRLARKLVRDDASARDLVQEVWTAALENPPQDDSHPRSWLSTVTRRIAAKQRSRLRPVLAQDLEGHASVQSLPDEAAIRWESYELLRDAVGRLDDRLRMTVLLRYQEGLFQEKIARELQVSERTVRNRLKAAQDRIREQLGELADDDPRHASGVGRRGAQWAQALLPLLSVEDLSRVRQISGGSLTLGIQALLAATLVATATLVVVGPGATDAELEVVETPGASARPEQDLVPTTGVEPGADERVAATLDEPHDALLASVSPVSFDDASASATAADAADPEGEPGPVATIAGSVLLDGEAVPTMRAWLYLMPDGGKLGAASRAPLADDGAFEVGVPFAGMYHLYLDRDPWVPGSPTFLVPCRLGPDRPQPAVHVRASTGALVVEAPGRKENVWLHMTEQEWEYVSNAPVEDGRAVFESVPEGPVRVLDEGDLLTQDFASFPELATVAIRAGQRSTIRLAAK